LGITNNLLKRVYEHKNNLIEGFTKKYNIHTLVYYEVYNDIYDAIAREKRIKKWKRRWKIELIEKSFFHSRSIGNLAEVSLTCLMLRVDLTPLKKEVFGHLFEKARIAWNNNSL